MDIVKKQIANEIFKIRGPDIDPCDIPDSILPVTESRVDFIFLDLVINKC